MVTHEGTVLIVDDNLDACSSMATLMMLEGFEPIMATNGAKALAYLADHPAPCFIILDMLMPVMDGWEFLARKKELSHAARVPALIAIYQNPSKQAKKAWETHTKCSVITVATIRTIRLLRYACSAERPSFQRSKSP